jgi:hypothetical protein
MPQRVLDARMNGPVTRLAVRWALVIGLAGGLCGESVAGASGVAELVGQVQVKSYRDYLRNDLYAHNGVRPGGPQGSCAPGRGLGAGWLAPRHLSVAAGRRCRGHAGLGRHELLLAESLVDLVALDRTPRMVWEARFIRGVIVCD